jgi:hypothetical protein
MSDFLNMLVQRERGQADNAIVPRLPSRYEPAERKGSLAVFDKSDQGVVNPEGSLADEHAGTRQQAWRESDSNSSDMQSNGTWSESEQANVQLTVAHGRKPRALESSALHKNDNAKPEHTPTNTRPTPGLTPAENRPEPVGWVERSATHHMPDGLQPPASTHPTSTAENDHVGNDGKHHEHEQLDTAARRVTQTIAQPAEEFGQDKNRPITVSKSTHAETSDAIPLPELTTGHRQSAQREDLSQPDGQEEARAIKATRSLKRPGNRIPVGQEDQQTSKTLDEVSKPTTGSPTGTQPESMGEEIEQGARRPAIFSAVLTATTTAAAPTLVKRSHPASQNSSSIRASANTAMETVSVKPELTASRRDGELAPGRGKDNATPNERHNAALPVSREPILAQVTVRKPGDTAATSSSSTSGLLPNLSPDQGTQAPPPEQMPTINVTIGRIEVRAVTPAATPKRSNAGPKPMSLGEYLSQHSGGRNQRAPR